MVSRVEDENIQATEMSCQEWVWTVQMEGRPAVWIRGIKQLHVAQAGAPGENNSGVGAGETVCPSLPDPIHALGPQVVLLAHVLHA